MKEFTFELLLERKHSNNEPINYTESTRKTIRSFYKKVINVLIDLMFDNIKIKIPPQNDKKQLIIDINNLFVKNNNYCSFTDNFDVTLFHLAGEYQLITLSDSILADSCLYKNLDPFNCISYRIFTRDYKNIEFNKNSLVVTSEPEKFNIKSLFTKSTDLLKILDFLIMERGKYKSLTNDFINKDFIKEYENRNCLNYLFVKSNDRNNYYVESYERCKTFIKSEESHWCGKDYLLTLIKFIKGVLI
ncbi:hypothetical protein HERIO_967 [Hepatospora eriocheir]|uniref:FCP1 homology domain-containing protein n=1 Tax=Hepatospora eriocheir TaxID=1081669 RepID=A0A1X0QBI7_9MICR|nr:hypothetical protein HERIO_967 [Hepatospora eriocheir]